MLNDLEEIVDSSGKLLEQQKKTIEEDIKRKYSKLGRVLKKGEIKAKVDAAMKNIEETLAIYERHKNAIDIARKRAKGETVTRPADPIEEELQTSTSEAEVKEGEQLNPEQISNAKDSAKVEGKLGRLSEYEEKVKDIKKDTADYNGQTLDEINEENLALQEELEDESIIADLPNESKAYINSLKAEIKAADELVEKAETVYEKAVTAGANCVIRTRS